MTGPDTGGYERGTGAPSRSTGTQGTVGAILVVLALGLVLRLILAYLLPGSGFEADLTSFRFWASNLGSEGLSGFYERDFFHDYTPGYLYVLWLVGVIGNGLGGVGDLIKIPPIIADLAIGYLVWSMVRELGGRDRNALIAAAVVMVNPIFWFDNVVWGQVDAAGVVFLLLGLRALWRDRPERAAIFTVIAALVKPQLGILVPIVAVVTIRRALWPTGASGAASATGATGASLVARIRAWEARTDRPIRILTTGAAGFLTAVALSAPFGLSVIGLSAQAPFITSGLVEQIAIAAGGYPYLTVNAYNLWAVIPSDLGNSLASTGQWVCDAAAIPADRCGAGIAQFGVVPAIVVGTALLVIAIGTALWVVARRPDRLTLLVALAVVALAFFALPTRVHERYGFPFFALGAILIAISPRWRPAYLALSLATFANMYVVLTTLYPPADPALNPIRDWLGVGEALRSQAGVTVVALLHTAAFGWAWLQLRGGALDRLEDDLRSAAPLPAAASPDGRWRPPASPLSEPHPGPARSAVVTGAADEGPVAGRALDGIGRAAPAAPAAVVLPTWSERPSFEETGWLGWARDRWRDRPTLPDRSALLQGERGGRLDRLDAWFLVVIVVATFGLRTFRLAEPYQMHFDEVYHARTATEFLQHWRYGESHDIYEWTHPHLAKYLMAAGLVAFGRDQVEATGDLGGPVRAAAIEPRRNDVLVGDRAGERVHIATGDEIRTEDLRTRSTVSRIDAPGAGALAIDTSADRLIVGYDDGSIATLDLISIGSAGDEGLAPIALTSVGHPVTHLLVTDDGTTILAASSATLTAVDIDSAAILGSVDLPDIADLSGAGAGTALVAVPTDIDDPAAIAAVLVELIGGDAADYEGRLADAAPDDQVVLGAPGIGDDRTKVDEAIADGRLAGVTVADLPRIAVATSAGVSFVDPSTAGVSSTIDYDGGAHGLALVTEIDDPKLYVSIGPADDPGYAVITVGGDDAASRPADKGRHPLPGPGTRVAYDDATQQVHILGRAPGSLGAAGDPWTVYVVEPHGNAVYADAPLPAGIEPAAWAMDVASAYVAEDRQQLLVFGDDGRTASIAVGSHAFAWRLPGVIAGVLMAACLYLLARILFRRRLVAALVGAFVLLDGMLFVQSRIGMNDVYVGLFIIAAYTVFAAVWTGWWRWRGAFWVAMPIVGVLLGLALASKWVAAYAIGALALLLLVRSALGRVVTILGLIAVTGVLGYLGLEPAGEATLGNLPFIAIMIGLTMVAVWAAVFHPIAWTDEEMWLALIGPAAAGAVVFFGAVALGRVDTAITLGPLTVTPLLVAIALGLGSVLVYGAFRIGGDLGFGPLARRLPDGASADGLAPVPAPTGWLRPGWLVGLPLVWATLSLVAIPLAVYVASYLPWAAIENHRIWEGFPTGATGQSLTDLTGQMYGYHSGLTSAHPASSPWWAWPFDLKPVWFYQEGFAGGTSAAIYDAGNLVIWWFGALAVVFVSIMAFRRRSPALALIAIAFATQWVSWARIDRASFQYHYYTALPFAILALAYLVAELWHGPSARTWLAVRIAGAAAVLAPAALWLQSRVLCGVVGVDIVNPGSQACPAVIPDLVLTLRSAGLLGVVAVGAVLLGRRVLALQRAGDESPDAAIEHGPGRVGPFGGLILAALVVAAGFVLVAFLPDAAVLTWTRVPVEPIALIVALPLGYIAAQVFSARDPRRFVVGLGVAAVSWFVVWYPNLSALPLPSTVVNAFQGLIPTYLYAFQFPVNTVARPPAALASPFLVVLTISIGVACLVVAYSASVWRAELAGSADATASGSDPASGADSDGLARSGGGA